MMQRVQIILWSILGLGLPWHGAITVFGPDWMRWWKELVLVLIAALLVFSLLKHLLNAQGGIRDCLRDKKPKWLSPYIWGVLFLLWGVFLVLINKDLHTALVAYRYLGLGFIAMLLGVFTFKTLRVCGKNGYGQGVKVFHIFNTSLTVGVLVSTLFGLWAKLGGGYSVLENWYSNTISSWVPGQTIPLYHKVGDFIRLQGASSGPVEYAHLGVIAVWYILFFPHKRTDGKQWAVNVFQVFSALMLCAGIYHSGSRAALLGVLILLVAWSISKALSRYPLKPVIWSVDKLAASLLVLIVLTGMLKFTFSKAIVGDIEILNKNIVRASDSDHLTRPLEAWGMALERPLMGNLGQLGPAARAKNLAVNNNDQAPIAESVPFDVAAQLGFIGLLLWLLFWVCYWRWATAEMRVLVITFVPLMLLATIFDMTPVSLSFYIILGLGLALPKITPARTAHHKPVLNLKRLAFKPYIQKVWGWQEREQKNFVAQELELGGVQLVHLEGKAVSTFSLEKRQGGLNVYSFYVHPLWQSQGLGAFVLNTVIPPENLHLKVLKVNSRAKAFYEFHNFNVVGEDEHHWHLERLI